MNKNLKQFWSKYLASVMLMLVSANCFSLGLGVGPTGGTLNQPLNIEIPVYSDDFETYGLKASLANTQRHELMAVDYPRWMPALKFELIKASSGNRLKVTTKLPIKEPVVNFVIKVEHQGSVLYKEFTLLFDPIELQRPAAQTELVANNQAQNLNSQVIANQSRPDFKSVTKSTAKNIESEARSVKSKVVAKAPTKSVETAASSSNRASARASNSQSEQFIVVKPGQSLWRIARAWDVDNSTINQRMAAIFNANPRAFIKGDRDRLAVGATLKLIGKDQFSALAINNQPTAKNSLPAPASESKSNNLISNRQTKAETEVAQGDNVKQSNNQSINSNSPAKENSAATELKVDQISTKAAVMQHISQLNQVISEQRQANQQLKRDIIRLERILERLASAKSNPKDTVAAKSSIAKIQVDSANTISQNAPIKIPEPKIAPNSQLSDPKTESASAQVDKSARTPLKESITNDQNEFTKHWRLGLWLGFGILLVVSIYIFFAKKIGKIKASRFTRRLNKRLEDIERLTGEQQAIDKFEVPGRLSQSSQIKCLRSAADFYCRCNRNDLAKELVNESLIQFSGNRKIVRALLEIRDELRAKLDESMQSGIVEKISIGNFPKPGIVLEAVKGEDELKAFNDEFIKDWTNKVTSIR
jgi:Tfp pilus assembly protein FimV